jgi:CheY-like chemotaxis protein
VFFESKSQQKIARCLQRVLIVDPHPLSVRMLSDLLRGAIACETYSASEIDRAYSMCRALDPQLIFVEHPAHGADGYALTRKLRRSDLACRTAPVVMVTAEATAASILAARDAGLHEFLRKPYTANDLQKRLEAVTLKPRDWVEAVHYIGPDRRRFDSASYAGPRKRRNDADKGSEQGRLIQAIRIINSAAKSLDTDLMQVRRALGAQATELQRNPLSPDPLRIHAAGLAGWCGRAAVLNPQLRSELATRVADIAAFMPPEGVRDSEKAA